MPLAYRSYADARVLAPTGRLDHEHCDAFRMDLTSQVDECVHAGHTAVLDLSGLEYISSAGLRCFMLAAKQAKAGNSRILMAAMRPLVAEIFQISRFNLVFEIFPTVREAVASVSVSAAETFDRG